MLESDEAARRLGVKVTTLYAYVSRGLLVSYPAPEGRKRLFAFDDVERLARRSRQGKTVETRMATVTTAVTQLTDEGPIYRGRRATELAVATAFEDVADWLWRASAGPGPADGTGHVRAVDAPRPRAAARTQSPSDRMRWVVVMAGAGDRLRSDLRPEVVTGDGQPGGRVDGGGPALAPTRPRRHGPRCRCASRRPGATRRPGRPAGGPAEPGAERGPGPRGQRRPGADGRPRTGHLDDGGAGGRLHPGRPLRRAAGRPGHAGRTAPRRGQPAGLLPAARGQARHGPERALNDTLRWQGMLPGFGHSVYKHGDARYGVLVGLFEELATAEDVTMVHTLVELAAEHSIPPPNVDLALAAVAFATGMPPDAGRTTLRRGPGGRMDGPLPRGAGRAAPPLPGPGRLRRSRLGAPSGPPGAGVRAGTTGPPPPTLGA